jgi:hypothetical protein
MDTTATLCMMFTFPIKINTKYSYTFNQPEWEYILIDTTKQYYVKSGNEHISNCRRKSNMQIICEQIFHYW